jgi:hypothetical protein
MSESLLFRKSITFRLCENAYATALRQRDCEDLIEMIILC